MNDFNTISENGAIDYLSGTIETLQDGLKNQDYDLNFNPLQEEQLLFFTKALEMCKEFKQFKEAEKKCTWSQEDYDSGTWDCSNCNAVWDLNDGTPFDNDMRFCPQCGSEIDAITLREFDYDSGESIDRTITKSEAEKALAGEK